MSEAERSQMAAELRRELAAIPQQQRHKNYVSLALLALYIIILSIRPIPIKLHPAILIVVPFFIALIYFAMQPVRLDQAVKERIRQYAVRNLLQRGLLQEVLQAGNIAELIPADNRKVPGLLEACRSRYAANGAINSAAQALQFLSGEYEMLCYIRGWHYEGALERKVLHPANTGWRQGYGGRHTSPDDATLGSNRLSEERQVLLEVLIDILEGRIDEENLSAG